MKKSKVLKYSQLKGVCRPQKRKFKKLFGDKVIVTEKKAMKYYNDFDFSWATVFLLSVNANKKFGDEKQIIFNKWIIDEISDKDYFMFKAALWARCYINDEVKK
jgi:hypothetical protein